MMASGDTKNVLEECLKKINANTAQLESFLRQVFAVFMLAMLAKGCRGVLYGCLKGSVSANCIVAKANRVDFSTSLCVNYKLSHSPCFLL